LTSYVRARAVRALVLVSVALLAALVLPFTELRATPSPAGATLALAVLIALAEPIVLGWAMSRGDHGAERVSPRAIWFFDLMLVLGFGLGVILVALGLRLIGIAPAGGIAARALATFLGAMLIAHTLGGWRMASVAPVVVFIAVVIAGRGVDIDHPAPWAWIAAPEGDVGASIMSVVALVVGTGLAFASHDNGSIGVED
jgi:hypothetical protein